MKHDALPRKHGPKLSRYITSYSCAEDMLSKKQKRSNGAPRFCPRLIVSCNTDVIPGATGAPPAYITVAQTGRTGSYRDITVDNLGNTGMNRGCTVSASW